MIITLLTDFGEADGYVGAMRGVLLSIAPAAHLVDITHQIPPQDVQRAAWVLVEAYSFFPSEAVHLVVVDPGVGSTRRPLAVETPSGRFVAPDNGVLSYALAQEASYTAVELTNSVYHLPSASKTFHGRDIFSPVAAHLASGVDIHDFGPVVDDLVQLPPPRLEVSSTTIKGEVLRVDHFGNVLTNIISLQWLDATTLIFSSSWGESPTALPPFQASQARVSIGQHTLIGIHPTYSAAPLGQAVAIVGSSGELEIAINQGNAAEKLSVLVGDSVTLYIQSS